MEINAAFLDDYGISDILRKESYLFLDDALRELKILKRESIGKKYKDVYEDVKEVLFEMDFEYRFTPEEKRKLYKKIDSEYLKKKIDTFVFEMGFRCGENKTSYKESLAACSVQDNKIVIQYYYPIFVYY